jgi:hypothetical protein
VGVWEDDGDLLVHRGDCLLNPRTDEEIPFGARRSCFNYYRQVGIPGPAEDEPTVEELNLLDEVSKRWNWQTEEDRYLAVGWPIHATTCGANKQRAHGTINGDTTNGKTTYLERVVLPIVTPAGGIRQLGNTTEAGIRQTLENDAIPVILDEQEVESQRDRNRVDGIYGLARLATSGDGKVVKGTVSGQPLSFRVRSCFLMVGINESAIYEQDQNRLAKATLCPLTPELRAKEADTERLLTQIDEEFGAKLFRRTLRLHPTTAKNAATLAAALIQLRPGTHRLNQVHAHLIAAYGVIRPWGERELTDAEAMALLTDELGIEQAEHRASEALELSDGARCLQHLLAHRIDTSVGGLVSARRNVKITIQQALNAILHNDPQFDRDDLDRSLLQLGMKVTATLTGVEEDGPFFAVANSAPGIREVYAETHWRAQPYSALRRDGGNGRALKAPIHMGGRQPLRVTYWPCLLYTSDAADDM